jgi:hypothetical protein
MNLELTWSRHGHLMLFDDEEQLEVRHVISLAHHDVSIYSGGDQTPEGELFIKRNALCLSRRTDAGELTTNGTVSKPFYLFSELCSEKEDFYFAMLRNQERRPDSKDNPPVPLQYDVKDIITLVQKLHSSEEHLQTRWINAIIGRIFLALYKTSEVEDFIRALITKKISRVKKPSFLSKIVLKHVDLGEAAPVITNPRLKDLTVDGELVVEADVRYSGNFRIEVAATARIDLGTRFKAREVNLLLAVVVKRVEGHAMIRIKPPPSNRIWLTFSTTPKIDLTIEPIVSSRQITYTLILRQIENRIKEVVAESLVLPHWDDIPFFRPVDKLWRGGIWATDEKAPHRSHDPQDAAAQDGDVDEVAQLESEHAEAVSALPEMEKSNSMPAVDASPMSTIFYRKTAKSSFSLQNAKANSSSTSVETRASTPERTPRVLRSGSFTTASSPIISTNVTNADAFKNSTPPDYSHAMAAISALSQSSSSTHTPVGSPPSRPPSRMEKNGGQSSPSPRDSVHSEKDIENDLTPQPSLNAPDATDNSIASSYPSSPASISTTSFKSEVSSTQPFGFGRDRRENSSSTSSSAKASTAETKRLSLAAVSNVAATAKKWGWNAIQRHQDQRADISEVAEAPTPPLVMGRGRPLPPPGTPLPPPDKKTKTAPIPVPKRKPIPPPTLPQRSKNPDVAYDGNGERHPISPPPLPKRRNPDDQSIHSPDDGLFVVAAPASDSLPGTPISENEPLQAPVYMQPWVDDVDEEENEAQSTPQPAAAPPSPGIPSRPGPPRLPKRRAPHRAQSSSPEEDGDKLPSWLAAQEEEQRAKSAWVGGDAGLH